MDNNVQVNLTDGTKEVVISEGFTTASPKNVVISGNIKAPSEFFSKRKEWLLNLKLKTHLLVNLNSCTLKLVVDETNPYDHYEVNGKMVSFNDFVAFNINTGKKFHKQELIYLLKRNKMYFVNKDEHGVLLTTFMKFIATVNKAIENSDDQAGKKKRLEEYSAALQGFRVDGEKVDFNPVFLLEMPLFVGFPSRQFKVNICLDPNNNGLEFYFESADLWETQKLAAAEAIAESIAPFEEDFAVIYV